MSRVSDATARHRVLCVPRCADGREHEISRRGITCVGLARRAQRPRPALYDTKSTRAEGAHASGSGGSSVQATAARLHPAARSTPTAFRPRSQLAQGPPKGRLGIGQTGETIRSSGRPPDFYRAVFHYWASLGIDRGEHFRGIMNSCRQRKRPARTRCRSWFKQLSIRTSSRDSRICSAWWRSRSTAMLVLFGGSRRGRIRKATRRGDTYSPWPNGSEVRRGLHITIPLNYATGLAVCAKTPDLVNGMSIIMSACTRKTSSSSEPR